MMHHLLYILSFDAEPCQTIIVSHLRELGYDIPHYIKASSLTAQDGMTPEEEECLDANHWNWWEECSSQ